MREKIALQLEAGDLVGARQACAALVAADPSRRTVAFVARSVDALAAILKPVTVAVLRSVTLDPLAPMTRALGLSDHLDIQVHFGEFNQFEQELAGGAALATRPDVLVFAARLEELAPRLLSRLVGATDADVIATLDDVLGRIASWIAAARTLLPDALVLVHGMEQPIHEAYGLADARVTLGHRVMVRQVNDQLAALCRNQVGVFFLDLDSAVAEVGRRHAYDSRMMAHARLPYSADGQLAVASLWARFIGAHHRPRQKCVVLDCDNTLWGGVVGEDGPEGIALGAEFPGSAFVAFQDALLTLHDRGVILCLNSKNNEADVLDVLTDHPFQRIRREHVAAHRVNWQDKATNIAELAQELNIGLDSMVFIDDSDFECQLVRERLPMVQVVQTPRDPLALAGVVPSLTGLDALDVTGEDRTRGQMYQAQAARSRAQQQFGSMDEYLSTLGMRVDIAFTTAGHVPRVSQLTKKTNQFNLTTRRYTEAEIEALVASPDADVLQLHLGDRFGEHGLTGVAIGRTVGQSLHLDTFLMSCRIIGRGVEDALVALMCDVARARGLLQVVGEYRPSAKNAQTSGLYPRLGFLPAAQDARGNQCFERLTAGPPIDLPSWLVINRPEEL